MAVCLLCWERCSVLLFVVCSIYLMYLRGYNILKEVLSARSGVVDEREVGMLASGTRE